MKEPSRRDRKNFGNRIKSSGDGNGDRDVRTEEVVTAVDDEFANGVSENNVSEVIPDVKPLGEDVKTVAESSNM